MWFFCLNSVIWGFCRRGYCRWGFCHVGFLSVTRTLGIGSKTNQHDQNKKVIENTSCKNALIHRCLGAVEVFFYRHHHFFTSTLQFEYNQKYALVKLKFEVEMGIP